jgi:hypothetical protein
MRRPAAADASVGPLDDVLSLQASVTRGCVGGSDGGGCLICRYHGVAIDAYWIGCVRRSLIAVSWRYVCICLTPRRDNITHETTPTTNDHRYLISSQLLSLQHEYL